MVTQGLQLLNFQWARNGDVLLIINTDFDSENATLGYLNSLVLHTVHYSKHYITTVH